MQPHYNNNNITAVSNNDMSRTETQQNNERGRGLGRVEDLQNNEKESKPAVADRWLELRLLAAAGRWALLVVDAGPLDARCCGLKGNGWWMPTGV